MTPTVPTAGRHALRNCRCPRWRSRTIGRCGEASRALSRGVHFGDRARRVDGGRTITANGLSGRCFRSRSFATAASFRASARRWKPPSPFIATILPARIASAAASSASCFAAIASPSAFQSASRGPHAGQAFGSAWKRRSVGSRYSSSHAIAHRKDAHGRPRAIIGQRFDDGVSRPAMRAVRERIAIAPVAGIADFAETIVAGREVREHARRCASGRGARPDREARVAGGRQVGGPDAPDRGRCRRGPHF